MNKLLIACFVLLVGCTPAPTHVTFSGDLQEGSFKVLTVENIALGLYDTLATGDRSLVDYAYALDQPALIFLREGWSRYLIYAEPGDHLELVCDDSTSVRLADVSRGGNALLESFRKALPPELASREDYEAFYGQEPSEFLHDQQEKLVQVRDLLDDSNHQQAYPDLVKQLSTSIDARVAAEQQTYPNYYNYVHKKEPALPDNFPTSFPHLHTGNADLLHIPSALAVLSRQVGEQVRFQDYPSRDEYYQAKLAAIRDQTQDPQITSHLIAETLAETIKFGGGAENLAEEIEQHLSANADSHGARMLADVLRPWKSLKTGMPAPEFKGIDRSGAQVSLTDLKGQHVYVDVWATWCGPCIAEIPSLKEIEHDYEDRNLSFVSVSIDDQEDKQKWIDFILEKELGGTQIFAGDGWNSEIVGSYLIQGIPRFILIDDAGNLVKVDAPRPSDPSLRDLLDQT